MYLKGKLKWKRKAMNVNTLILMGGNKFKIKLLILKTNETQTN